jgi:hypothetical protein
MITVPSLLMLIAAFAILGAAVLLGSALAFVELRTAGARVPVPASTLHGLLAIAGLICLLVALRGPPRGIESGTSSFGVVAAVLIAAAAVAGVATLAARVRRKPWTGLLIGMHATLAVGGFVVLAAYLFA